MSTENAIRQSEFAEKHNLTAVQVADLRRDHLTEGVDFWSEGRAIFWSEEAAARVESLAFSPSTGIPTDPEIPPSEETAEPEPITETPSDSELTVRVLKRARNYRFVYADLDGERIAVMVPRNSRKNLVGKNIKVTRGTDGGTTTYSMIL